MPLAAGTRLASFRERFPLKRGFGGTHLTQTTKTLSQVGAMRLVHSTST